MSGSQSPWRYRNHASDLGKTWMHPFGHLPLHITDQIISDDSPYLGTAGLVSYFNHFQEWTGPVAEGTAGGWTLTGTTGTATIVHSDTKVGAIVLTTDNTGSATFALQRGNGTTGMNMAYTVGKRMWFFIRFKLLTVASMELFMGLGTADTSPSTTGTFPSDGLFFEKAASATVLDFHARKDGTSTEKTSTSGTLVDDTYTVIGFHVDELGNIMPFKDGVALTAGYIAAGTANIPAATDVMQLNLAFIGQAMTMTVDWILCAQEL
jgi:hypothetical protein